MARFKSYKKEKNETFLDFKKKRNGDVIMKIGNYEINNFLSRYLYNAYILGGISGPYLTMTSSILLPAASLGYFLGIVGLKIYDKRK